MPSKKHDPHYPNPWMGRIIVGSLAFLVVALLAFAFIRPDETGRRATEAEVVLTQMDAAQAKADQTREADRSRPSVP
ncbi:hypothetical protein [Brevundimonas sp.]|uniref:hypothetical protein n=1 Tax=Brevundimonas sp. TaxID=1871086 RepID=UPI0035B41FEB